MDFFNNLGKNISKTAKTVGKKSEELVEITKLNINIGSEEDKIKKLLLELGSELYEKFSKGEALDEQFNDKCTQIKAIEDTVASLKEKIKNLKGHSSAESPVESNKDCATEVKSNATYKLEDDDK